MDTSMITKGSWHLFLTLKDERLLLVKRRHPFVVIMPILLIGCLTLFFISSGFVVFQEFFVSSAMFFVTILLLTSIAISLITKAIVDWYFHVYILTSRRILELRYSPLTSSVINDVLLDKVSCTEIDIRTNGFLNELIDMGDVIITFDRPTHQEEFTLRDVQESHGLATYLTRQLIDGATTTSQGVIPQTIWFKQHSSTSNASY
jgi:hypothetical protein